MILWKYVGRALLLFVAVLTLLLWKQLPMLSLLVLGPVYFGVLYCVAVKNAYKTALGLGLVLIVAKGSLAFFLYNSPRQWLSDALALLAASGLMLALVPCKACLQKEEDRSSQA